MLTAEENGHLMGTGPGTPMGNLYRRSWLPILLPRDADFDEERLMQVVRA
jgi:hypothetical protein